MQLETIDDYISPLSDAVGAGHDECLLGLESPWPPVDAPREPRAATNQPDTLAAAAYTAGWVCA